MFITAIIFALSIILFVSYTIITTRIMKARLAQSNNETGESMNEDLIMDMVEQKLNIKKLAVLSVGIGMCFVISFLI